MNIKQLFADAFAHRVATKPLPPPGRHSIGRALRAKHRITNRKNKR